MLKSERTRLFLEVGRLVAGSEAVEAVVVLLLEDTIELLLIVGGMTGVEGEGGDEIDAVSLDHLIFHLFEFTSMDLLHHYWYLWSKIMWRIRRTNISS